MGELLMHSPQLVDNLIATNYNLFEIETQFFDTLMRQINKNPKPFVIELGESEGQVQSKRCVINSNISYSRRIPELNFGQETYFPLCYIIHA